MEREPVQTHGPLIIIGLLQQHGVEAASRAAREENSGGQGVKDLGGGKWRRVLHSAPLDYHKDGEVDSQGVRIYMLRTLG